VPRRVLIIAATTGYQTRIFEETAHSIGFEVIMATDRCHHLEDPWGDGAIPVRFQKPEAGALELASLQQAPDGILAVGDKPTVLAAATAEVLGLRFHPRHAVEACRNKFLARERFLAAGMQVPYYYRVSLETDVAEATRRAEFPCVLKPLGLSGSRGVIRANDEYEFSLAFDRIRSILTQRDISGLNEQQDRYLQIESYIPGSEFAVEGLAIDGRLKVLAIFDKPDPLEGPFFEETIYVTPSRACPKVQRALVDTTQQAVTAVGLTNGPVHAEMRYNQDGVWMLEVAARPIGGLCARSLRFGDGMPLEELLLRFAVGEDVSALERERQASGVMMIPVPKSGVYHGVSGVEEASAVPGITDVAITAKYGQRLLMLPEGSSYLGFLFARGETPEEVERALRNAHSRLRFEIMAELLAPGSTRANY
jgi:biotin carboxylase